jgi:GT2 family glycosyltransferase
MPRARDHKGPGPGSARAPAGDSGLAVIVPATDSPPTLARCLEALISATRAPDRMVVVSDPPRLGPAAARNAGAAACADEILVFVDSDVAVRPDALARIADAFARDPSLDAIFGAYDDAPSAPGPVSRFRNLLHHHVHATAAGPASTFWAGLGAIRRAAFERLGGFDARAYPRPSIEDIELGARLTEGGGRVRLDPAIRGTHLKRWSLGTMIRADFALRGVPWTRLAVRRRSVPRQLNLGWRHRAGALASVALAASLLLRRPAAAAAAAGSLLAIHAPFYALLARRGGGSLLAAGIPLHVIHHLTAAASVPAALALELSPRGSSR